MPRATVGLTSSRIQSRYRLPRGGASLFFVVSRDLSTQTSTSTGPPGGPPPGFNVDEAKKPLPAQPSTKSNAELANKESAGSVLAQVSGEKSASAAGSKAGAAGAVVVEKKAEKKLTVWEKVKHGVQHFWDGTKLLGVEIKISTNLAVKMAAGYELSRRERRQVCMVFGTDIMPAC